MSTTLGLPTGVGWYALPMLGLRPSRILPLALVATVGLSAAPARAHEPSRWIAALPFGVGQFQNGEAALGIFFASGEALLGATSIATAAITMTLSSADTRPVLQGDWMRQVDYAALNDRIRAATTANHIAFAGWAALTAAGILEAQVNFGTRRMAAEVPLVTATAAPVPGGGLVGVRAVF